MDLTWKVITTTDVKAFKKNQTAFDILKSNLKEIYKLEQVTQTYKLNLEKEELGTSHSTQASFSKRKTTMETMRYLLIYPGERGDSQTIAGDRRKQLVPDPNIQSPQAESQILSCSARHCLLWEWSALPLPAFSSNRFQSLIRACWADQNVEKTVKIKKFLSTNKVYWVYHQFVITKANCIISFKALPYGETERRSSHTAPFWVRNGHPSYLYIRTRIYIDQPASWIFAPQVL